ncbi:MAG: response regulator [Rhizomicrobium sp.]
MGQTRLNLKGVTTLLVDSDLFTRGLVSNMLRGFGMESPTLADTGAQARHHLQHHYADLVIMEAGLPDMLSADLIRWIRRQEKSPFRFVPIIVLSGYTQLRLISTIRDAGANLVVKKPVSPAALFDRILWVARTARPFIEAGDYIGPDRRFKNIPPPDGDFKRDSDTAESDAGNVANQQKLNSAA